MLSLQKNKKMNSTRVIKSINDKLDKLPIHYYDELCIGLSNNIEKSIMYHKVNSWWTSETADNYTDAKSIVEGFQKMGIRESSEKVSDSTSHIFLFKVTPKTIL